MSISPSIWADTVPPARFGGTPLDYQLIEEEDGEGFTWLTLAINPTIEIPDESAVIDVVLRSLGPVDHTAVILRQARTLRVRRMKPVWTALGAS